MEGEKEPGGEEEEKADKVWKAGKERMRLGMAFGRRVIVLGLASSKNPAEADQLACLLCRPLRVALRCVPNQPAVSRTLGFQVFAHTIC